MNIIRLEDFDDVKDVAFYGIRGLRIMLDNFQHRAASGKDIPLGDIDICVNDILSKALDIEKNMERLLKKDVALMKAAHGEPDATEAAGDEISD